ncbi:hypothetical protein F511_19670 [Dorcoceras hygrometricum]|uniref:Uncharacterized protein n=1 Tax=Dorcoceras hygrometricum TaxID=472368 RepID=A0A2Z7C3E4_9LAMI|nr:hypothetical protein F511_19670 [Dorcoceras hygrometricum]
MPAARAAASYDDVSGATSFNLVATPHFDVAAGISRRGNNDACVNATVEILTIKKTVLLTSLHLIVFKGNISAYEIVKDADAAAVMSTDEADIIIAKVLEETLELGVSATEREGQGVDEAMFEEDFAQWLDDFVARHNEPEFVATKIDTQAEGSINSVIDKEMNISVDRKQVTEETMPIDDLLLQISDDLLLPSITAVELTKIRLGEFLNFGDVQRGDLYSASLPRISSLDKGKGILVEDEPISGNPAREIVELICTDVDFLVKLRDQVMVDVENFFHSFSINKLTNFDALLELREKEKFMLEWAATDSLETTVKRKMYILAKYKEQLLRMIMESHRQFYIPGQHWTATASQIFDLLSDAHSQSMEDLLAQQPNSTCWVRPVILVNGVWTPVQGPDFWRSSCRLSLFLNKMKMPAPAIQDIFVPHVSFIEPVQYWTAVPWMIRIWQWTKDEPVIGNPAREIVELICTDVDFLVKLRDQVMVDVENFFHSFSINKLTNFDALLELREKEKFMLEWAATDSLETAVKRKMYILAKYKEQLLRMIMESHRQFYIPGQHWTATASQIFDLLSDAHSQSMEDLLAQQREHGLSMDQPCPSSIDSSVDSGAVLARFYSIANSTCWVRPVILVNGVWTPVQGPDFWRSSCRLSLFLNKMKMPAPAIQDIFVPHVSFIEPLQYWTAVPWMIRIWQWTKVCEEIIQFSMFGGLRPVREDICQDITVYNLGVERIPTDFLRMFAQGVACHSFVDSVVQRDLGDLQEVVLTDVEEVDLVSSDVSTVYRSYCGRNRQSGPRPETRLLCQPALEGLTRSARTDSPRRIGRKKNFRRRRAAARGGRGGGGLREDWGGGF